MKDAYRIISHKTKQKNLKEKLLFNSKTDSSHFAVPKSGIIISFPGCVVLLFKKNTHTYQKKKKEPPLRAVSL